MGIDCGQPPHQHSHTHTRSRARTHTHTHIYSLSLYTHTHTHTHARARAHVGWVCLRTTARVRKHRTGLHVCMQWLFLRTAHCKCVLLNAYCDLLPAYSLRLTAYVLSTVLHTHETTPCHARVRMCASQVSSKEDERDKKDKKGNTSRGKRR